MVDEIPLPEEVPLSDGRDGRPDTQRGRGSYSRARTIFLWIVPAIVLAVAFFVYGSTGRYVSTDNAYVKQDRIDIAAQISGDVRSVFVVENQSVKAGDPILALDDKLARVELQRAEAKLAAARADVAALTASFQEKQGELAVAKQTAGFEVRDYQRQRELSERHLVSETAVDSAHRSADLAVGAISVLELQLKEALARLDGNADAAVDQRPEVLAAAAERERARVNLGYTMVHAPQAGVVSHLPKVGDRAIAGTDLFAIVVDHTLWVEANFKETDLAFVRPGQPATVKIDTYGGRVWRGRVESISQATGAEFSLLPPQNASGNWVKVVQRIPVRVVLEMHEGDPPLRDGMSADVEIDTGPNSHFERWFARRG